MTPELFPPKRMRFVVVVEGDCECDDLTITLRSVADAINTEVRKSWVPNAKVHAAINEAADAVLAAMPHTHMVAS